jgi:uncharacterized protein (TIGR03435 family)
MAGNAAAPRAQGADQTTSAMAQAPAATTSAPSATSPTQTKSPAQSSAATQEIEGIWQGTLMPRNATKGVRFVIKIAKDTGGGLKASLYNADQGTQPINFDAVSMQGSDVELTSPMITISGKLSADGNSIDAVWGVDTPSVSFARSAPDGVWAIPEPIEPMADNAHPGIEAATIKPTKPGSSGKLFAVRGTHFLTSGTNLNDLLAYAYGVHTEQIIGAPDWAGKDLFDIDSIPDVPGRPGSNQMREMTQKLLADRLQFKFHRVSRELAVYAITVAPGGPKLAATKASTTDLPNFIFRGLGDLFVTNMTINEVADGFQSAVMDRPVVDHTGLTGRYDFTLKWMPDDSQFAQFLGNGGPTPTAAEDNLNASLSLNTAAQEQLGLKFEATQAPDDVIVIDHVEKPLCNPADESTFRQIAAVCSFGISSIDADCVRIYETGLERLYFSGVLPAPQKVQIAYKLLYAYRPGDTDKIHAVMNELDEYKDVEGSCP